MSRAILLRETAGRGQKPAKPSRCNSSTDRQYSPRAIRYPAIGGTYTSYRLN
jgi:hypothetical protein